MRSKTFCNVGVLTPRDDRRSGWEGVAHEYLTLSIVARASVRLVCRVSHRRRGYFYFQKNKKIQTLQHRTVRVILQHELLGVFTGSSAQHILGPTSRKRTIGTRHVS